MEQVPEQRKSSEHVNSCSLFFLATLISPSSDSGQGIRYPAHKRYYRPTTWGLKSKRQAYLDLSPPTEPGDLLVLSHSV